MIGWIVAGIICVIYFAAITAWTGLSSKFHCIWLLAGLVCFGIAAYIRYARQHEYHMPAVVRNSILVVCILGFGCFVLLEGMIISQANATPEAQAEYVLVLGAQVRGTTLSWELRSRLDTAISYLEENPGTKAVLSGGQGNGEDISEADAMYAYMVKNGIDAERLILEDASTTTQENIEFSRKLMGNDDASVVIVTSGFHVYRAVHMAEKQGLNHVSGYGSPSKKELIPTYYIREAMAMVKAWLRGDI